MNFSATCCTAVNKHCSNVLMIKDNAKYKRINVFFSYLEIYCTVSLINNFFLKGILLKNRKSLLWICTVSCFFIIILAMLIFKTHNHFSVFKNMKIKTTKFIIIISYFSQACDWPIDEMITL